MNEIEMFANEVCERRAKVVEAKKIEKTKKCLVERYVRDIIDIFNISNYSEESTILICKIKLFKDYNVKVDEIFLNFSIKEDDWCRYDINDFENHKEWGDNSDLIQKLSTMKIPKSLYNDIINYFNTKLSKQFKTTLEEEDFFGKEGTVIEIKDFVKAESE